MKCIKCENKAYCNNLCQFCFMKQIEKRIRKEIRLNKLIQKNDILVISDALCEYMVKRIVKGMPITIRKKANPKDKKEKKVLLWTLDDEIIYMMDYIFKGKQPEELGHGKNAIKLFIAITDEELTKFAKLKKLSFKKKKSKEKQEITKIIDKIEKKHPETRYSMYQSSIALQGAMKK